MLNIKIKKLNKNVQLPKQSTQGAAGMDFYQILMSRIISILASIWVLWTGARWL